MLQRECHAATSDVLDHNVPTNGHAPSLGCDAVNSSVADCDATILDVINFDLPVIHAAEHATTCHTHSPLHQMLTRSASPLHLASALASHHLQSMWHTSAHQPACTQTAPQPPNLTIAAHTGQLIKNGPIAESSGHITDLPCVD